jgi:hypothetical protein
MDRDSLTDKTSNYIVECKGALKDIMHKRDISAKLYLPKNKYEIHNNRRKLYEY